MNPRQRRVFAIILASLLVMAILAGLALPLMAAPTTAADLAGVRQPVGTTVEPFSQVTGTDGREYIADQQGRALQFRGMNHKTDDPGTLTDQLLADARARGFNLIRLSIYWDEMEPTDDHWDEDYFTAISDAMDRVEAHGMWVALDMHQDNFNTKFGGKGMPDWVTDDDGLSFEPQASWLLNSIQPAVMRSWENLYQRPAFRAAQIDAWQEVVTRFQDKPALLGYDLLNEPFGQLDLSKPLAQEIERIETTRLTPMYQRETDAIRKIDPKHWVFVEAPNQASLGIRTWLGHIDGEQIAFYPHLYDAAIETATYTEGGVVKYDPTFFATYASVIDIYPKANHVPVLFGEWGVAHPERGGMDQFIAGAIDLMADHGSGWTMFNGCRGDGYCAFDATGKDRPGIGQIVQPYAQAIAGAPTSFGYDLATKTLLVVLADSSATGTTDLVIPASTVYPGGWKIETSDADGTWSSTTADGLDPAIQVASVTLSATGEPHAICLKPVGAPAGCEVPVPDAPVMTGVPSAGSGDADPAVPVSGQAGYTG